MKSETYIFRRITTYAHRAGLLAAAMIFSHCGNENGPLNLQSAPAAVLTITDSPVYDFGSQLVEAAVDKTFTVTNTGLKDATAITASFNLSLNFSYAGGKYPGTGATCGIELKAGENCTLVVRFLPKYVGTFEDAVQINFYNGNAFQTTGVPALKAKSVWGIAGDIDSTFAPSGRLYTSWDLGDDTARAVIVQADGNVLSAGSASDGNRLNFALTRHRSDGTSDSSFGVGGKVVVPVTARNSIAMAIVQQQDGKIVAAGQAASSTAIGMALVRLHSDGSLDSSFATQGIATFFDSQGDLKASSVLVLADRRIIVAGTWQNDVLSKIALVRLEADGTLDTTFGVGGMAFISLGSGNDTASVMALVNGKLLVAGATSSGGDSDFALSRYSLEGALDTSFGTNGWTSFDVGAGGEDVARSLAVQTDGKLVLAGSSQGSKSEMAVARFAAEGSIDTTFGNAGKTLVSLGAAPDVSYSVLIQSNKKILALGASGDDLGIVRLSGDGSLDVTFGNNGKVVTSLGSGRDVIYGAALQSNGKILAVGESYNGSDFDFFLARFWP